MPNIPFADQVFNLNIRLVVAARADVSLLFSVSVNGEVVVKSRRTPLLDTYRHLPVTGDDASGWIAMRRGAGRVSGTEIEFLASLRGRAMITDGAVTTAKLHARQEGAGSSVPRF